jgi:hypothetical protein
LFREELEIEEDIGCLRAVKVSGSHIRDRSSDERETSKRNGWMDGYYYYYPWLLIEEDERAIKLIKCSIQ